jgi:hypothetical protein
MIDNLEHITPFHPEELQRLEFGEIAQSFY